MKKSERLTQELLYLQGKTTFPLADLMKTFAISKRTAVRDVQSLEELLQMNRSPREQLQPKLELNSSRPNRA